MEDLLLAVLSAFAELLFEVLFQVVLEEMVALVLRSVRNLFEESNTINPILAGAGYFLLGTLLGIASLRLFPHPLVHPSRFHGISLVISPLVTGLIMSQLGGLLRRKGKQSVRIESFGYGFIFALGLAIIRFFFSR